MDMTSDASGSWGLGASFGEYTLQRMWTEAERNYPIYVKELLAFVEAVEKWKSLL